MCHDSHYLSQQSRKKWWLLLLFIHLIFKIIYLLIYLLYRAVIRYGPTTITLSFNGTLWLRFVMRFHLYITWRNINERKENSTGSKWLKFMCCCVSPRSNLVDDGLSINVNNTNVWWTINKRGECWKPLDGNMQFECLLSELLVDTQQQMVCFMQ